MKNSISLLMFVLLGVLGYMPSTAQQYFNKRYTVSSGGIVFSSVLQHNKKYYVTKYFVIVTSIILVGALNIEWGKIYCFR